MPAPGINGWGEYESTPNIFPKILPKKILLLGLAAYVAVGTIDPHYTSKVYTSTITAQPFLVMAQLAIQVEVGRRIGRGGSKIWANCSNYCPAGGTCSPVL
jgi:hypothetical protein